MLKAILIDDEEMSRNILRDYIIKYCPDVTITAEAENIQQGIEVIKSHKPDIVFLDVEMPKGNGFDLLEQIKNVDFETVFVTAYDHYAIQALNYSAAYYILKPISIDELISSVEKIKKERTTKNTELSTKILLEYLNSGNGQFQKIVLPLPDGFEVVNVKDIVHCVANDNFTDFHFLSKQKMMICRTLKFYEELLKDVGFIRVHKSHLVNITHIQKYNKGKGGQVTMCNGAVVDVSPNKKEELMRYFERGK
jgi:two-component system LytT family response regulator